MGEERFGFGRRSIGFVGGVSLLLNNCLGPGVAEIPKLFQQSGWFVTILIMSVFGFAAYVCGWMLLYAQSRVPVSLPRQEFGGLCKFYLSRPGFIVSQIFFILAMTVLCVGGVVQTAQLMDFLLVRIFGQSCGLQVFPNFQGVCRSAGDQQFSVFDAGTAVVSAGYGLAALCTVPFGFFPLEDNIKFQVLSCLVMCICVVCWMADFSIQGLDSGEMRAVGDNLDGLIGCALFNYCIAFSLPSWNNERIETVPVHKTLITAIALATVLMTVVGVFAGHAFVFDRESSQNLLDKIDRKDRWLSVACMYMFSLCNNITSIPVFSICIRYCLVELEWLKQTPAAILAVLVPWLLVIPFSCGDGFENIVSYGGSLFLSVTGFLLPPILFYCAVTNDAKLRFDKKPAGSEGDADSGRHLATLQLKEHPSRSGSIVANLQFRLIHGAAHIKRAKLVSVGVLALLACVAVASFALELRADLI